MASAKTRVDPLRLKTEVCPEEPLLVNESVSTVTVPILFVLVVCVVPRNTSPHVSEIDGSVLQLFDADHVPPPLPDQVVIPSATPSRAVAARQAAIARPRLAARAMARNRGRLPRISGVVFIGFTSGLMVPGGIGGT